LASIDHKPGIHEPQRPPVSRICPATRPCPQVPVDAAVRPSVPRTGPLTHVHKLVPEKPGLAFIVHSNDKTEGAMKRDLLAIGVAILTVGLVSWSFWGNPGAGSHVRTILTVTHDPALTLVTERSPYMRTER
jgi:hypothetical protein